MTEYFPASAAVADVQAKMDLATHGDVVTVPEGNVAWVTGLTAFAKGILLRAAGPGAVTIRHNAGSAVLVPVTEVTSNPFELKDFRFLQESGGGADGMHLVVTAAAGGKPSLIHGNYFETNGNMLRSIEMRTNRGIIYSNSFYSNGVDDGAIAAKAAALTSSWITPHTMGSVDDGTNNLYIEDNSFIRVFLQAIDFDDNSRVVFRYNNLDHSALTSHGADTSTYGARHWEIYNNTLIFLDLGVDTVNMDYFFYVRGGSGVIADNVIPDINSTQWGNKAELKFTVQNLRRNAGPYACWAGGYPAPHQFGRGISDAMDPVYISGNSGGGNYGAPSLEDYSPDECAGGPPVSDFIQVNRDYYLGTVRPGYAKYQYPHPLRLAESGNPPIVPGKRKHVPRSHNLNKRSVTGY